MTDIINLIKADTALAALIGQHIYLNYTTYKGDCIVYTFATTSNNRCSKRIRLKITIIANSIVNAVAIEERIADIILTLGDKPLNNTILQVTQNGGGDLYDTDRQMNHRIMYFDIVQR